MLTHKKHENNKGNLKIKLITTLSCLIIAMALMTQSVFAFFSDVVTGDEEIVAGTLDLVQNSANFFINGSTVPATREELDNINPGDYVTVSVDVENVGSKSAWLLMDFTISGAPATDLNSVFSVYEGIGTDGQILSGVDDDTDPNMIHFISNGDTIIDGTVETEDGSVGTSLTLNYTVVFASGAGNEWQDSHIGISYVIKALQYRNNPTPNWDDAVPLQ